LVLLFSQPPEPPFEVDAMSTGNGQDHRSV